MLCDSNCKLVQKQRSFLILIYFYSITFTNVLGVDIFYKLNLTFTEIKLFLDYLYTYK